MTQGKDWPWTSFLANRQKKVDLVVYLSKMILIAYWTQKKFYMSSSRVNCTKSPINTQSNNPFSNNYEEEDTRMFRLCSIIKGDIIICSTDTDLLVIALINHTQLKLGERNIVIHFGKAGVEFACCWISQFVKVIRSSLT